MGIARSDISDLIGLFFILGFRTTDRFGDERFGFTFFLICGQCVFNTVWSAVPLVLMRPPPSTMPQKSYFLMALTYMGGMLASYWALDYISFPSIVLMKSCKFLAGAQFMHCGFRSAEILTISVSLQWC
jgi:hypothetical protein